MRVLYEGLIGPGLEHSQVIISITEDMYGHEGIIFVPIVIIIFRLDEYW